MWVDEINLKTGKGLSVGDLNMLIRTEYSKVHGKIEETMSIFLFCPLTRSILKPTGRRNSYLALLSRLRSDQEKANAPTDFKYIRIYFDFQESFG